jgi:poly(A) polymerase
VEATGGDAPVNDLPDADAPDADAPLDAAARKAPPYDVEGGTPPMARDPAGDGPAAPDARGDWLRRLAALAPPDPVDALRLSRAEARALATLSAMAASEEPPTVLAHRAGVEAARSASLLRAARARTGKPDWQALARDLRHGAEAAFPLAAADLLAAGVPRGPALGRALEAARATWLAEGFRSDRAALLDVGRAAAELQGGGHGGD